MQQRKLDKIASRHGGIMHDILGQPLKPVYSGTNAILLFTHAGIVTVTYDDDGRIVPGKLPVSETISIAAARDNYQWLYGEPYKGANK